MYDIMYARKNGFALVAGVFRLKCYKIYKEINQ